MRQNESFQFTGFSHDEMSHGQILIAFGQSLLTFYTYTQASLIESSLLPQLWLWYPLSSNNPCLLQPTFATLALYALSEPFYSLFWTWLYKYLDVSEPSLGVCISCMAHAPILVMFALPDDINYPTPSPWKSQTFRYGVNILLTQASAARNAAWLLMLGFSEPEEKLQGLHVIFGCMAMFMTAAIEEFCSWGLVDRRPSVREIWRDVRKDAGLRKQLLRQAAWLMLVRMACRWIAGLKPIALLP